MDSAGPVFRSRDTERGESLLREAARLLSSRPLDLGERMILQKVLGRLRAAVPHPMPVLGEIERRVSLA